MHKMKIYWNYIPKKWQYEIKSGVNTFAAILAASLLASPVINTLLNTDLPTIQQFSDIYPVLIDSISRAVWMTLLTRLGLSHRK